MSADSFHHHVEQEAKKVGYLYDFDDYQRCIDNVMRPKDFRMWENQLSQS